jgi:RNA-directed DNA polymerase
VLYRSYTTTRDTTEPFYYLGLNLYLAKTPETPAAPHTSCMETFFEQCVLDTVLDGKTFDLAKEHDAPGKYGKQRFATRVVEPKAGEIDFSGFVPLLDRIVAVLDHHAAMKAAAAPAPAAAAGAGAGAGAGAAS